MTGAEPGFLFVALNGDDPIGLRTSLRHLTRVARDHPPIANLLGRELSRALPRLVEVARREADQSDAMAHFIRGETLADAITATLESVQIGTVTGGVPQILNAPVPLRSLAAALSKLGVDEARGATNVDTDSRAAARKATEQPCRSAGRAWSMASRACTCRRGAHAAPGTPRRRRGRRLSGRGSTNNCALLYCQLGRYREAIAAGEESVAIYRNVGLEREGDLASALNTLGLAKSRTDDVAGAVAAWQECADIRRHLASNNTNESAALAKVLSNLASALATAGDERAALAASKEAVDAYGHLDADPGARYDGDRSAALHNHARRLLAANRAEEAAPVISEAVQLRRSLADRYPDLYTDELARSLTTMARVWFALEDLEGSSQLAQEAVAIRDRLVVAGRAPPGGVSGCDPRRVVGDVGASVAGRQAREQSSACLVPAAW